MSERAGVSSSSTRRIALAGNGGIALELVDALCGRGMALDGLESCELVWLVKHAPVGDAPTSTLRFLARALELRRRRDDGDVREEMIDWLRRAVVVVDDDGASREGREEAKKARGGGTGLDLDVSRRGQGRERDRSATHAPARGKECGDS